MFADYMCVCFFYFYVHPPPSQLFSFTPLARWHQNTRADRFGESKATKEGKYRLNEYNSTRRQSWRECASFPHRLYFFVLFFVLMSTPRSGLDPPSLTHVWYIDVYYTETLSLVHWRLKYTRTKYVPCKVEFPAGRCKKIFFSLANKTNW